MLNQLKNTFNNKKVFITGHTGFKGSWMLQTLHLLGAEIKGYALAPIEEDALYHLINGDQLCDSVISDLRNHQSLIDAVNDFQPDFIFHLAAQPLVRLSYEIPSETFEVNAIGTANLLDAVRVLDKKCSVVLITTDKVYHNQESDHPYHENDRLGGYDPYSASKACAELLIDSYRNSFFNINKYDTHKKGIAVARAGNVIGGGDWSDGRLIPDIAKALAKNKEIIIRNPKSIRPWQHVLEPIIGYLLLAKNLALDPIKFGQAFNFGPNANDALSVIEMVNLSIASWGNGKYKIEESKNQPHEAGLLKLDISKANNELHWFPKMDAKSAVSLTLDWYRNFVEDINNIDDFTTNQIINFLST